MEHVPTLCALSTVGIAATGFALGHQEQPQIPRPPSNKRKAPGTSNTHRSFSSPLTGTTMTSPKFSPLTPPLPNESIHSSRPRATDSISQSSQGGLEGLGIHSGARLDSSIHSGKGSTRASTPGFEEESSRFEYRGSGLAKPSWLRRISTISSQNDSHTSSPRPASSLSFSNTSTAPFIAPSLVPSPATLPPNKLVKRTTSQRALSSHQNLRSSSLPQGPTFRRPATSHQRSATLRQAAMAGDARDNASNASSDFNPLAAHSYEISETGTSHIWRPYFSRGYPKANSGPRKRHTSGFSKATPVNHVVKDSDALPTLILATEITPRLSEDELDDTGDRSLNISPSRPDSPFDFQPTISTPAQESLQAHIDNDRKPRHSFSISDMFAASSPSSWISRTGSLRLKKSPVGGDTGNRNMSSPLPYNPRSLKKNGRLQRRRNITDGSIFESPRNFMSDSEQGEDGDAMEGVMSSPLPPVDRMSAFNINLPGGAPSYPSTPVLDHRNSPHSNPYYSPPPAVSPSFAPLSRPKRLSMATSDPNSTVVGSDTVASGEDSEMDFQSETAYDSMATRATVSSNSGIRGPRIETIFDESPPPEVVKEKLIALEDLISCGSFDERISHPSSKHSMMDEDDEFPTPVRPLNVENDYDSMSPVPDEIDSFTSQIITSSPVFSVSGELNGLRLHPNERTDSPVEWDFDEAEEDWDSNREAHSSIERDDVANPGEPFGKPASPSHDRSSFSIENGSSPAPFSNGDRDVRSSLFDWSEQQKESPLGSSIRPRTVHGKQGPEGRGSRATGRRRPSALHLRSQSVPVSRDPVVPYESYNSAAKYGTWGLGNKGVSEDWNDDFDFDEAEEQPTTATNGQLDEDLTESRLMKVPQAIMERQASVHGQFSQVQELNLLVEELKRLRTQASMLDILDRSSSELWKEAEGIINLATLDDDETLFPPRSPSSPSFNFDAFDDDSPPSNGRSRKQSTRSSDKGTPVRLYDESESRRSSVIRSSPNPFTPPSGRPRKESSTKAKSVLETIYHQRGGFEPALNDLKKHPGNKLPFDTQSLRDLVVRAGVVTRALKEIVRKAEGVSSTPNQSPERPRDRDPPFSQIFTKQSPIAESPSRKPGLPKSNSAHGYLGGSFGSNDSDLSGHMKLMTVV